MITNTFASSVEGWTFLGRTFSHSTTGGTNGTGSIYFLDTTSGQNLLIAPSQFLGDLTQYRTFKFDANFQAINATQLSVLITGANGMVLRHSYVPHGINTYSTYSFSLRSADGWVNHSNGFAIDKATLTSVLTNVTKLQIEFDAYSTNNHTAYFDNPTLTEAPIACFTQDTMILTDRGERPIQDLVPGDMVWIDEHRFVPIRWISSTQLDKSTLEQEENLRPIVFRTGSLGKNLPKQDLRVSPQHRMLVKSKTVQNAFGVDEVLIAAKRLLPWSGVSQDDTLTPVTYYHMLFDKHHIVCANGALSESMYTGPEAIKTIPPAAWEELTRLFPNLMDLEFARPVVKGKKTSELLTRLEKNNRPLYVA